jgi:hypothetical protein
LYRLGIKIFFLLTLLSGFCFAQQEPKIAKDSLVWKKKKQITWNDSTGKVINSLSFNCYVYSSFENVANKKAMSQPSRVKVNFDYDRKRNYTINDDPNSTDYLFSQTVLNIHQLYAKKLRKACFQLKFKPGYHGLLESAFLDYFEQMRKRDNDMRLETENGKNIEKLNEWSEMISKELEDDNQLEKDKK